MSERELRALSTIGFAIVVACALLIFPPFSPFEWSFRRILVQVCILVASNLILIIRRDIVFFRAAFFLSALAFSLSALLLFDIVLTNVPIYSVAIASLPRVLTPCRKVSALGQACLIASRCTNKDNYMIVRGAISRDIVKAKIRSLPAYTEVGTKGNLTIARMGYDEYSIVAGTQSTGGGILEFDYPALDCSSLPDIDPLFSKSR